MHKDDRHITHSQKAADDLFEQLRQISDALWDATQRNSLAEVNLLLDQRQVVLEEIAEMKPLEDHLRRKLMATVASDKYLARQLDGELSWLERRLRGLGQRREAAAGYRANSAQKSFLTRSG